MKYFLSIRDLALTFILISVASCQEYRFEKLKLDGLQLYWHHEVFHEDGRVLEFQLTSKDQEPTEYQLIFDVSIRNRMINVVLIDKVELGECAIFPGWSSDSLCTSRGKFCIPEKDLSPGEYLLVIKSSNFDAYSKLTIGKEKITLDIPQNPYLTSSVREVFPIPENLLFGNIVYRGHDNTTLAQNFYNELISIGLNDTTMIDKPYRYLNLDEDGKIPDKEWEPDNYSMGLLFNLNTDFVKVVDVAERYGRQGRLNIYLYSSNGDQARFKENGETVVVYAD